MHYRLRLDVPLRVRGLETDLEREDFFGWAWANWSGLQGVHEGSVLSDPERLVLDDALAPRNRDWVGETPSLQTDFYFESLEWANRAQAQCAQFTNLGIACEELSQPDQDWQARWKADFLSSENRGLLNQNPYWQIVPSLLHETDEGLSEGKPQIRIYAGAAFGTGSHPTTQMCLTAIREHAPIRSNLGSQRALDFGCGSGILALALAHLGWRTDAVEIDPLARENAADNIALNASRIRSSLINLLSEIPPAPCYDLIVANVLRPVLLDQAQILCQGLHGDHGILILSGLLERDLFEIKQQYGRLLGPQCLLATYSQAEPLGSPLLPAPRGGSPEATGDEAHFPAQNSDAWFTLVMRKQ